MPFTLMAKRPQEYITPQRSGIAKIIEDLPLPWRPPSFTLCTRNKPDNLSQGNDRVAYTQITLYVFVH